MQVFCDSFVKWIDTVDLQNYKTDIGIALQDHQITSILHDYVTNPHDATTITRLKSAISTLNQLPSVILETELKQLVSPEKSTVTL